MSLIVPVGVMSVADTHRPAGEEGETFANRPGGPGRIASLEEPHVVVVGQGRRLDHRAGRAITDVGCQVPGMDLAVALAIDHQQHVIVGVVLIAPGIGRRRIADDADGRRQGGRHRPDAAEDVEQFARAPGRAIGLRARTYQA